MMQMVVVDVLMVIMKGIGNGGGFFVSGSGNV